jgi:hypothetical protein
LADFGETPRDTRVIVPMTRGTGTAVLRGAILNGKKIWIDVACLGQGSFRLDYRDTGFSSRCTGVDQAFSDDASFAAGTPGTFTIHAEGRWELRVTEDK